MSLRIVVTVFVLLLPQTLAPAASTTDADVERGFNETVRPFLATYCVACHSGPKPMAQFDLSAYKTVTAVAEDYRRWGLVHEKLSAKQMPPQAMKQPPDEARQKVIAWIDSMLRNEAQKNAGDPGLVLARRLSNAEYNYTIRDLTGVDIRPTREFPVDPANPAGFDNSGESLAMSPALLDKYLRAAREVANHMVLEPNGIAFAPHPVLVETDRDKYCVERIVSFYRRQDTDYSHYFEAAWRFKHRAALGQPKATLASLAVENEVSAKYLATIWHTLEGSKEDIGPLGKLQSMWRALPAPKGNQPNLAHDGSEQMRDFVVGLRKKIELLHTPLNTGGLRGAGQAFLMWRNRQYATHRTDFDRSVLQVEGEPMPVKGGLAKASVPADNDDESTAAPAAVPAEPDPDLHVPAGQRARYEAAFAKFSAVFPDAFYVSERGRYFPDNTRDTGRHLSAGFHNLMGYFRDDLPLYNMILDEKGRRELDELWRELDFVASANIRTYVQWYLFESGEARDPSKAADLSGAVAPEDKEITSQARIERVAETFLARARATNNETMIQAIQDHFDAVNSGIRWVEQARIEAEPRHLDALLKFAARAYRRPLTAAERDDLLAFYRKLRNKDGLSHEDAMRDSVVGVLMSPDFCYRIDLVEATGSKAVPLSDYSLASRLSYFLWSSMPDEKLLAHAAAGDLHSPEVLASEARRMLKDARAAGLATEFAGNWLDFRRFEEHNAVDRERFPSFDSDLREVMFQEPVRLIEDMIHNDRSVLDLLFGKYTFVNRVLAKHYGMSGIDFGSNEWVRVDDARPYGRGGLMPMSIFLTKNAPGLRTSPVKRGYWVVKRVLGEQIPPPPAAVPELPRDEAKLELPLRDMLVRHRADPTCAACHARFDSFGLAMEGYGPIGERRTVDLAGHPVDARAQFPGGSEGTGIEGLLTYIREHRQDDYIDNLCRKMMVYAFGRGLILSDEPSIEEMRGKLAANGYRFSTLIESIVTSPQFLRKRAQEVHAGKGQTYARVH